MNNNVFEIFWSDLTPECQARLLDFLGGENGNYDVFPIATIAAPEFDADPIAVCTCGSCDSYDGDARYGECHHIGGWVNSDTFEPECNSCSDGSAIWAILDGNTEVRITSAPFILIKKDQSAKDIVDFIRSVPPEDQPDVGLDFLYNELQAFLDANELDDFGSVKLELRSIKP